MLPMTAHKLKVRKQVNDMKYSLDMKKLEYTRSTSGLNGINSRVTKI